jgi:manganese/zinc/iron transport system ATP- binding protein
MDSHTDTAFAERLGDDRDAALVVRGLSAGYGGRNVLSGVDLVVRARRSVAIVGPNGAGKSTLLRACLGLVPGTIGLVAFFGAPLEKVRSRIAYVPQRESVDWDFPITVLDVVAMGRYARIGWFGRVTREHREASRAALRRVRMEEFESRQIGELSGGQQQRVFLARALASEAELYLLDEPTSGVDAASRLVIENVLAELVNGGATIVCVTHDLDSVQRAFSEAVLVHGRVVVHGAARDVVASRELERAYGAPRAPTRAS